MSGTPVTADPIAAICIPCVSAFHAARSKLLPFPAEENHLNVNIHQRSSESASKEITPLLERIAGLELVILCLEGIGSTFELYPRIGALGRIRTCALPLR